MHRSTFVVALALAGSAVSQFRRGQAAVRDEIVVFASQTDLAGELNWRNIGPANFSGRIVDIAVHPKDPTVWYVASATGGLFKSVNRGLKFETLFGQEGSFAIGDVAIDPSNPETVWVGTGEANNQRSSYAGDGIYKSVDGGKTWKNLGLRDSHHIGRVLVDPKDGNRVFVAVLGHLYSANASRGLYRTTDGGKSWKRVLSINPDVGVVDVAMHPTNSKVLLAASYERRRRAWNFDGAGPGSGIWRSTDGGDTWKRLEGGLPKDEIGRIGLCFAQSEPDVVYACVENANAATVRRRTGGEPKAAADFETQYLGGPEFESEDGDAEAQGRQRRRSRSVGGEIYKSTDAGKTWKKTNRTPVGGSPGYYYGQIRVNPSDANHVFVLSVPVYVSKNGGKSFSSRGAPGVHVDHHALWIDPNDRDHMLLGNDGGLCETFDSGKTWMHFENIPAAQFYAVGVDMADPYRIYGGTQDNGTWGMPSAGPTSGGTRLEDCFKVSGGDGFYAQIDPEDPNTVYVESQFGGLRRVDLKTMRGASIKPRPGRGEGRYRFNWNSPILISPHNHATVYFGGNKLFKSLNRGNRWRAISADLTTQSEKKLAGNVPHCTITTIDESPMRSGLLWVGTDDGELWMTPDDGHTWKNLNTALPAETDGMWISRVEASHFEEGRAYVSFTGYREDVFTPMVYVTDDYGLTFKSIAGNLPKDGAINVVREDPRNEDLLFVGTELGVWVSTQRGGVWEKLGKNLPTTPVHDLVVHPREPDLIAATHGRGMWIVDVCGLEHWNQEQLAKGSYLIKPRSVRRFPRGPTGGYTGSPRRWTARNPKAGVDLCAVLNSGVKKAVLRVYDAKGDRAIKTFDLPNDAGMHVVTWGLRTDTGGRRTRTGRQQTGRRQAGNTQGREQGARQGRGQQGRGQQGRGQQGRGQQGRGQQQRGAQGGGGFGAMFRNFTGRFGRGRGRGLSAGTYRVELEVDGKKSVQPLVVVR